jgi:hypothetical protein
MFVWTLPSPACMCSATKTRPRSTSACAASIAFIMGSKSRPAKIARSGSRSSTFQEMRMLCSCTRAKTLSSGSVADRRRVHAEPLEVAQHVVRPGIEVASTKAQRRATRSRSSSACCGGRRRGPARSTLASA